MRRTERNERFHRWLSEGDTRLDTMLAEEYDDLTALKHVYESDAAAAEETSRAEAEEKAREAASAPLYTAAQAHAEYDVPQRSRALYLLTALLLCAGMIAVLVFISSQLPSFGKSENPANNEVVERYVEKGMEETGAVNIVAGMILDYRAFDTLGESNVLFTAVCAVLLLLKLASSGNAPRPAAAPAKTEEDLILQRITRALLPFILIFGCYVILNGHLSPGGGFSGGAVMGAGLILYYNAFGAAAAERFFTIRTFRVVSVSALSFYAVSKAYSFFTGANHLPSFITAGVPGRIFSAGLIPYLNIAVGLVVMCTMYGLFTLFRKGDI